MTKCEHKCNDCTVAKQLEKEEYENVILKDRLQLREHDVNACATTSVILVGLCFLLATMILFDIT